MRYYDIQISSSPFTPVSPDQEYDFLQNGVSQTPSPQAYQILKRYTSLKSDGSTDMGALQVEFDLPIAYFDTPAGSGHVKIWGVSLQDISQSSNFNGQNIEIYGGMSAGLPLANPKQQNLLLSGTIFQGFGNWQGTKQSLEFIIKPAAYSPAAISFNWENGIDFATMITNALKIAFGDTYSVDTSALTPGIVYPSAEYGYYENISQFAEYVRNVSLSINKTPGYPGVSIAIRNNTFIVSDGYYEPPFNLPVTKIDFKDLVGQPTWIDFGVVQIPLIMRGDIHMGDYIQTPQGYANVNVNNATYSASNYKNKTSFLGIYRVIGVRHVGNSRQADGNSWVTIIEAISL